MGWRPQRGRKGDRRARVRKGEREDSKAVEFQELLGSDSGLPAESSPPRWSPPAPHLRPLEIQVAH